MRASLPRERAAAEKASRTTRLKRKGDLGPPLGVPIEGMTNFKL